VAPRRKRTASIYSAPEQNVGEQENTVAGGNISTNDPGPWLEFVRGYLHDLDQRRTRRDDELGQEIILAHKAMDRLSDEFDLYRDGIRAALTAAMVYARTTRLIAVAALVAAVIAIGVAVFV
jgi:hypothetical protein